MMAFPQASLLTPADANFQASDSDVEFRYVMLFASAPFSLLLSFAIRMSLEAKYRIGRFSSRLMGSEAARLRALAGSRVAYIFITMQCALSMAALAVLNAKKVSGKIFWLSYFSFIVSRASLPNFVHGFISGWTERVIMSAQSSRGASPAAERVRRQAIPLLSEEEKTEIRADRRNAMAFLAWTCLWPMLYTVFLWSAVLTQWPLSLLHTTLYVVNVREPTIMLRLMFIYAIGLFGAVAYVAVAIRAQGHRVVKLVQDVGGSQFRVGAVFEVLWVRQYAVANTVTSLATTSLMEAISATLESLSLLYLVWRRVDDATFWLNWAAAGVGWLPSVCALVATYNVVVDERHICVPAEEDVLVRAMSENEGE